MKKRNSTLWFIAVYGITIGTLLIMVMMGSRAVTVISENLPIERKFVLILDPGHGGVDGGATSCSGKLESHYNLDIALRLDDLLHLLGYETKMTRRSDISIHTQGATIAQKKVSDLRERVRICNETENGILISIHQNTFPSGNCQGSQVFYPDTPGSKQLASILQAQLRGSLNPENNRKEQKGKGIYLLEELKIPGVLIECGFLSNPQEDAQLQTDTYQKRICCVIATALIDYMTHP